MAEVRPLPTEEILDRYILQHEGGVPTGRLLHLQDIFQRTRSGTKGRCQARAGDYADTVLNPGTGGIYRTTQFTPNGDKRRGFKSHRIVWFLATGQDPYPDHIDHKEIGLVDSDGAHINAPSNLRLLPTWRDHVIHRNYQSKHGFINIRQDNHHAARGWKSFQGRILVEGKHIYTEFTNTALEAALAIDKLSIKFLGPEAQTNASIGLIPLQVA